MTKSTRFLMVRSRQRLVRRVAARSLGATAVGVFAASVAGGVAVVVCCIRRSSGRYNMLFEPFTSTMIFVVCDSTDSIASIYRRSRVTSFASSILPEQLVEALRFTFGARRDLVAIRFGLQDFLLRIAACLGNDTLPIRRRFVDDALLVFLRALHVVERILHLFRRNALIDVRLADENAGAVAVQIRLQAFADFDRESLRDLR